MVYFTGVVALTGLPELKRVEVDTEFRDVARLTVVEQTRRTTEIDGEQVPVKSYFQMTAWGATARMFEHLNIGEKFVVSGDVRSREAYIDRLGVKKFPNYELVVDQLTFIGRNLGREGSSLRAQQAASAGEPQQSGDPSSTAPGLGETEGDSPSTAAGVGVTAGEQQERRV